MKKLLLMITMSLIASIGFSDVMPPEVKRLKTLRDKAVQKRDAKFYKDLEKLKKKYAANENYKGIVYIEGLQASMAKGTEAGGNSKAGSQSVSDVKKKARDIVIPSLDFRQANISDVVRFLSETTRRLDPEEKGINIGLSSQLIITPNNITISIRDMNVYEALGYIAKIGGLDIEYRENGVVFILPELKLKKVPDGLFVIERSKVVRSDGGQMIPVMDETGKVASDGRWFYVHADKKITKYDYRGKPAGVVSIPPEVKYSIGFVVLPNNQFAFLDNRNDAIYFTNDNGEHVKTVTINDEADRRLQSIDGLVYEGSLIVCDSSKKQILAVDLKTYRVSVFHDLTPLSGFGTIALCDGRFFVAGKSSIYSFEEGTSKRKKVADLPASNITGLVASGNRLYAVVNGLSRVKSKKTESKKGILFEIDVRDEEIYILKDGLHYPGGLFSIQ